MCCSRFWVTTAGILCSGSTGMLWCPLGGSGGVNRAVPVARCSPSCGSQVPVVSPCYYAVGPTCVTLGSGQGIQAALAAAAAPGSEILLLGVFGAEFYFGRWLNREWRYLA